ncbi:BT_3928 family protein [Weeksella virosa]|uniref:DoxX family protein n=1 Tax=Weeksella virosa (strain ATCC 43766 / DSM 16922 / JCM 21250 / CCUG 30538 / CDC 9751 / IAM 14551 / NBRC 16016 / NCTC 11634 / CL345/78) TaxID=865938 RepID=F0NYS0_WEEVC|nr:BT_3928 family protein [Weeksella virosa]ADX68201.1 DoxX family protein [Weeksella virosa DSM 16922]MDK7674844.1 DoxX family membrane protein [Weeksella virosa]SUP54514.1 DoxX [Weeksella virosa]VEH64162.1 DoxX [Weeksella virosa]
MRILVQICRLLVGVLFIISGFVKIIDPIGMGYKLEEYFSPSVLNLAGLMEFHLPIAVLITLLEIGLGLMLLLGITRKFTAWALLAVIAFFTFLTFYSAYFNKVTDCGCFGDALTLDPWTSFIKDVVLTILILIILFGHRFIQPLFKPKTNYLLLAIGLILSSYVAYLGIEHSPIIDFRAYAVGKDLKEEMKSAEELGKKPSVYETVFTLKNKENGKTVQINDTEYVTNDKWYKDGTPWEILPELTKSRLVYKGYEPAIKDFSLDCLGVDKTDYYLNQPKVIFIIVPFAHEIATKKRLAIERIAHEAHVHDIPFAILSNNPIEKITQPVCLVDQIVLKTMTRSNPGIMTLSNGVVKSKYHFNDLPSIEQLLSDLL